MANTTNLNLYKPTRDDYISVSRDISENMQKIDDAYGVVDTAIGNLDESRVKNTSYAIVVNGSTSAKNITVGDFVVVINSTISGVADGLYIATENITAGTNVTSSKLSSANTGNGGLNGLNAVVTAKIGKIETSTAYSLGTMVQNTDIGKVKTWYKSTSAGITDYPSSLNGYTYHPTVRVSKFGSGAAYVEVIACASSGTPKMVYAYYLSGNFYWNA